MALPIQTCAREKKNNKKKIIFFFPKLFIIPPPPPYRFLQGRRGGKVLPEQLAQLTPFIRPATCVSTEPGG